MALVDMARQEITATYCHQRTTRRKSGSRIKYPPASELVTTVLALVWAISSVCMYQFQIIIWSDTNGKAKSKLRATKAGQTRDNKVSNQTLMKAIRGAQKRWRRSRNQAKCSTCGGASRCWGWLGPGLETESDLRERMCRATCCGRVNVA